MTNMISTEAEVRALISGLINQIAPDGSTEGLGRPAELVNDLGYHSLALLELAFAIEDEFDLPPIDEETGRGLTTDEKIVEHVLGKLRALERLQS